MSPLVTWELSVWISVGVTGYKQATVPDSHTPGSSALWATLDTQLLFPNKPAVYEQVFMCLCVFVFYLPVAPTCFTFCYNNNNESRSICHLNPSYSPCFHLSAALFVWFLFFQIIPFLLFPLFFIPVLIITCHFFLHMLRFVNYTIIFFSNSFWFALIAVEMFQPVQCLIAVFISVNWSSRNGKETLMNHKWQVSAKKLSENSVI